MVKKINIIFILIISFLMVSCGYKKVSQNRPLIHVQNITIDGENRISSFLKNDIKLFSNKNAVTKYDLVVNLKKTKRDKIKNISGKVTRYELNISANLVLKDNTNKKITNKSFNKEGSFDVAKNHFETISNEKIMTSIIMSQLSDEIINFITFSNKNK